MKHLKIILLLFVFITFPALILAQAPPPPPDKPVQNPIDGGLALLAVAGGAYAVKKLRGHQKRDSNHPD